jgi:hypothetical protein
MRGLEEKFESRVLPMFEKRTKELGRLLPELYLHGLAQGDFELALRGLLGDGAPLSASSLERLRSGWQLEYEQWRFRSLEDREGVYVWADGIYVKAGLEKSQGGALGADRCNARRPQGGSGRGPGPPGGESKDAWADVLRELKRRGLEEPKVVVADGHLGIWAAVGEVWSTSKEQLLEPQGHQRPRQVAEAAARRGQEAAAPEPLCTDEKGGREAPGRVRRALPMIG